MSNTTPAPVHVMVAKKFIRSVLPTPPAAPLKRSRPEPVTPNGYQIIPLNLTEDIYYEESSLRKLTDEEVVALETNNWRNFLHSGTPIGVCVSASENNPGRSYLYALNNVTMKKQWLTWLDEVRKFPVWLPATLNVDPETKKQKKEAVTTTVIIPGGPLQDLKQQIAELKEQNAQIMGVLSQIQAALFTETVDETMAPSEVQ